MPALPPIAGLLKIALHYAITGAAAAITQHFMQGTSATGTSNLNNMASSVAGAWNTRMAPVTMPNTTLVGVIIDDLSSPTAGTGVWAGSHPGTISGGLGSPAGAAMLINNIANIRQRGGLSRVWLPGMDGRILNGSDTGEWTVTGAANVGNAWSAYLGDVKLLTPNSGYTTLAQAYPHYYKGNHAYIDTNTGRAHNKPVHDPAGPSSILIVGNTVETVIGTQSRRNK